MAIVYIKGKGDSKTTKAAAVASQLVRQLITLFLFIVQLASSSSFSKLIFITMGCYPTHPTTSGDDDGGNDDDDDDDHGN